MADNKLYYGDNLDILCRPIGNESFRFISSEEPTQPMRAEAAAAGFYQHPLGAVMYPRLQILTIKELLEGKKLQLPEGRTDLTFRKPPRARPRQHALGDTQDT